ncbi:MAG: hypothetical protein IKN54_07300 [Lachnospiraceae bacterium]|nr:hypothetical protein [Lachnospiraceae bacterium]
MAAQRNRAEYFRERRKTRKGFSVSIEKEKADKFDEYLEKKGLSKAEWLNREIDKALNE